MAASRALALPARALALPALALLAVIGGAALLPVPAAAQSAAQGRDGMLVNSTTTDRYRQQALQGRRQHDFSPRNPPRNGRMIYGHWTPYDPPDPASLPADARKHVIVRGDTLWDIAGRYYRDNYLWPYVWEANSWVTYPHWIYPGDVLLIPPLMLLPDGSLQQEAFDIPHILTGYFPAGGEDAIYCGHFIADENSKPFGEIIGTDADPEPILQSAGDVVFVNVGSKDGVLPGDEFAVMYPRLHLAVMPAEMKWKRDDVLRHPDTGEKLGVLMKMSGRLKIILLGEEVSTAQILRSCDSLEIGAEIHPFSEIPIPLVRRTERDKHVLSLPRQGRGRIVWIEDMVNSGATGTLASIDLGSRHGVMPGDVFQVFRDEKSTLHLDVEHLGRAWDDHNAKRRAKLRREPANRTVFGKQDPIYDMPPRLIGELVVLYTETETATVRVYKSHREFYISDQVVYAPVDSGLPSVVVLGSGVVDRSRPLGR